jgi:CheY-like chemotaxis protein/HPt (histidine-containing phosphotransfer) domain-containing protein
MCGAEAVLGYSLVVHRIQRDEIATVAEVIKSTGALSAALVKHADGAEDLNPLGEMEICDSDSIILLKQQSIEKPKALVAAVDSKTIVLADDHRALRHLFSRKIRAAGHEVIEADSGDTALDLARRHTPDLFVLDVMMPGMSGYEVCEAIRSMPHLEGVSVILFSATDSNNFQRQGKEVGADLCVRKTSKSSELMAAIDELLYQKVAAPHPQGSEKWEQDAVRCESAISAVDTILCGTVAEAQRESAPEPSSPVRGFDPSVIEEISDGEMQFSMEIVEEFLIDTASRIEDLQRLMESGSSSEIQAAAHAIKGAAATLGCHQVMARAKELESAAFEVKPDEYIHLTAGLDGAFQAVRGELRHYFLEDRSDPQPQNSHITEPTREPSHY